MEVPGVAGEGADAVVLEGRGAVDQQGHGAERGGRGGDQAPDSGFVGEVGGDHGRAAAQRLDRVCRLVRLVMRTANMDGDIIAGARGLQGQGLADPASCAGDQGRTARHRQLVDAAELDEVQGQDDAQENDDDTDGQHGAAPKRENRCCGFSVRGR